MRRAGAPRKRPPPRQSGAESKGESGVGKELFARAIHGSGERKIKTVRCRQLRRDPRQSRGVDPVRHEKGAFTAHRTPYRQIRRGFRRNAVLDEVSELPLARRLKLLRALQEGTVEAVGGRKPVKVDVRIIPRPTASCSIASKATIPRRLFYRLHVLPLTIPALRMRREDIRICCGTFWRGSAPKKIAPLRHQRRGDELTCRNLIGRQYPQLENAVYRAVVMSDSDQLGVAISASLHAPMALPDTYHQVEPLIVDPAFHSTVRRWFPVMNTYRAIADRGTLAMLRDREKCGARRDGDRDHQVAISHYRGQMSEVARRLKIGRSTL